MPEEQKGKSQTMKSEELQKKLQRLETLLFGVTPDTIEVTRCHNTEDCRVYNIDLKTSKTDCNYESIIIHVPFDITQSIQFYTLEHRDIGKCEKDIIKDLFYDFCHKHTKGAPKYERIHHIHWCGKGSRSDKTLPEELHIEIPIANNGNLYMKHTEMEDILEKRFGRKPLYFSATPYTPFE